MVFMAGNTNLPPIVYSNGSSELATKQDIAEIKEHLDQLASQLHQASVAQTSEPELKGRSVTLLIILKKTDRPGRKYILDTGTCSLFLDSSNSLRFAVVDSSGEEQSVRLDRPSDGSLFDRALFITCDAASGENESFLRIRINGKAEAKAKVNYDLRVLPALSNPSRGPTVGSRADGSNPGSFTMMWLAFSHTVWTEKKNFEMMKVVLTFRRQLGEKVDIPGVHNPPQQ
jgi:hypothetical protein